MRRSGLAAVALLLICCDPGPQQPPQYPTYASGYGGYGYPAGYDGAAQTPGGGGGGGGSGGDLPFPPQHVDLGEYGKLDSTLTDFEFDGGKLEFELRREGSHVIQIARNRYAVPVMLAWNIAQLDNVAPASRLAGVVLLPPAAKPLDRGPAVLLAELDVQNPGLAYRRNLTFTARFGDPRAEPSVYAYHLPFRKGLAFSVLQGFHGAFSHRGSNEFAIDFDCPVATPVVAAREGVVVATNARALGSGTSRDYLDYKRVNFVLILHDDGTLGEYMHLAPSGIGVSPGQRVERGTELALSGNTGFSSTPHLHFQVMTAAEDGVAARSFPVQFAIGPQRVVVPIQGHTYLGWE
ncbi:MAG: M23 family metallopeptidase [Proteobacteria bacterium]|nr:M23 family metallopeptidase [Pseudomonadota bacterium]